MLHSLKHGSDGTESPARQKDLVWNVLTIMLVLGILLVGVIVLVIFANPQTAFNPLPPPQMPLALVLPTSTSTPKLLPPTWTVTPTVTQTATITPPAAVAGGDAVEVTPGPAQMATEEPEEPGSVYAFNVLGEVKAIDGTIFRPEHSCKWLGVAGQAFDLQNRPATGITVQVGGSLGRAYVDLISLTVTAVWYGPSGYEVFLSDVPVTSDSTLWVRLMDQSGLPLSGKVYFSTSEDCSKNLVVINFRQVR